MNYSFCFYFSVNFYYFFKADLRFFCAYAVFRRCFIKSKIYKSMRKIIKKTCQNTTKINPKSMKNLSKSPSNSIQNGLLFAIEFFSNFLLSLMDFGRFFDGFLELQSSLEDMEERKKKIEKTSQNHELSSIFKVSRVENLIKN